MTLLEDLTAKGFAIQINDFIEEGHPVYIPASMQGFTDFVEHNGRDILIFHTKDYNYIAYPWPEAHDRNMKIVYNDIDTAALWAEMRLHQMVTEFYRRDRTRAAKEELVLRINFTSNLPVASDQVIEALRTDSGKRKA